MSDVLEKVKGKARSGKWLEILAVLLVAMVVVVILLSAWGAEKRYYSDQRKVFQIFYFDIAHLDQCPRIQQD